MKSKFQCHYCKTREGGHWHTVLGEKGQWITLCHDCYLGNVPQRRRPMTKWEKRKIKFYRHEKNWIEDIRKRQVTATGDVAIVEKGRIKEIRTRDGRIIE